MVIRTVVATSLLALASALAVPGRAESEPPRIETEGAIAYLSGGISEEGQGEVLELGRDFNLRVVFTLASGEYLVDVSVKVPDARGLPLLETVAQGPFFIAKLPPGTYRITASLNGQPSERSASVGARGQQVVYLRWKPEQPRTT